MVTKEVIEFELVNHHAAGIDIGSREIYVSPDGIEVVSFQTFTGDYYKCCDYLKSQGIKSVAMEATGVYWMSLYDILEKSGLKVCLVHPREVQQVKGRKSDVKDSQWIQRLFSAGLLRESIVAEGLLKELRMLVRERVDLIEMGSTYVNKMQKYLELMNIKLKNVISQIHGESGLKVIRAIIDGERNPEKLLQLCHKSIKDKKSEEVKKSLEGNYSPRYILLLKENLRLWEEHQHSINNIDSQISELLDALRANNKDMKITTPSAPARHHAPKIKGLHTKNVQIYNGVDLSTIAGINDSTMLRLMGEIGTDLSRFPTEKHFVSWLGLSPKNKQSGKMKRRIKTREKNQAGLIFRQSAQSLLTSKHNAIGAFMRRLRGRKDSAAVIKAGARKIAIAVYNALMKGLDYVEQGTVKYAELLALRERHTLQRLATKLNYQLIEC
ncbi:IS110 family transposase [Bacteroidia bacterium]|nr:IS110 family transposase [Bacteroidia bacterium]